MLKHRLKRLAEIYRDREASGRYMRWMLQKTRPYLAQILSLLALNTLLTLLSVGGTLISKKMIDSASGSDALFSGGWFALFIGLTLCSIAIGAVTGILSTLIHERYAFGVREEVYRQVLRGQWPRISQFHSGDLMTRLTSDIDSVANGIASLIPSCCYLLIRLVISFFVLYYFDHTLALCALLLGPVGVFVSLLFGDQLRIYQKELKENESEFRAFMQESVANITVVKAFQGEQQCARNMGEIRARRLNLIKRRNVMNTLIRMGVSGVFSLGYLLAFGWSIYRLSRGEITYGTMSVFLALVSQVQGPILSLSNVIPQFVSVLASVGRVMEIDGLPPEPEAAPGGITAPVGMKMQGVSFAYKDEKVLADVTIDIAPCETVGLLGDSGVGKTTMARLLLALSRPQAGRVCFYDRTGHEEAAGTATRRLIAYVPQGNTLMSGTIRENLLVGREGADEAAQWQALELAEAAGFVRQLPKGLDEEISERGGKLSEGQAQRIAIARAILRAAPVMILDEATSALDMDTEKHIVENLRKGLTGTTCLIITHRPSLLDICGRCLRVEQDGRVLPVRHEETR